MKRYIVVISAIVVMAMVLASHSAIAKEEGGESVLDNLVLEIDMNEGQWTRDNLVLIDGCLTLKNIGEEPIELESLENEINGWQVGAYRLSYYKDKEKDKHYSGMDYLVQDPAMAVIVTPVQEDIIKPNEKKAIAVIQLGQVKAFPIEDQFRHIIMRAGPDYISKPIPPPGVERNAAWWPAFSTAVGYIKAMPIEAGSDGTNYKELYRALMEKYKALTEHYRALIEKYKALTEQYKKASELNKYLQDQIARLKQTIEKLLREINRLKNPAIVRP
ncbi:MAG: hypothetical protein V2A72_07160 [Candidatus Omnitrophota bacterium]